jgi:hypothetical protein
MSLRPRLSILLVRVFMRTAGRQSVRLHAAAQIPPISRDRVLGGRCVFDAETKIASAPTGEYGWNLQLSKFNEHTGVRGSREAKERQSARGGSAASVLAPNRCTKKTHRAGAAAGEFERVNAGPLRLPSRGL